MRKGIVAVVALLWVIGMGLYYAQYSKNPGPKLILLGLDGADWDLIDQYIVDGTMPTFARLKQEATWGYLNSLEPTLSPMLWTTIATGKRPDQHGIVDFLEWDDDKKERLPITSRHRKVPAIWNILSQHNLKVGIFNWLVTWPAEPVNGVLVSDRLGFHVFPRIIGPRLTLEKVSYPRDYAEKQKRIFEAPEKLSYKEISQFINISKEEFEETSKVGQFDVQNPDMNLRLSFATAKTFKNFAMKYWKRERPSFMSLYLDIPDTMMHTFMDFTPPKLERISLRDFQKYRNAVKAIHQRIDSYVAEILDMMDENTHLIIVSDHGFKFGSERPNLPATIGKDNEVQWHDNTGIVLFWGKHFQKRKQILGMSLYDVVPTILQFFNLPIARDMSGKIVSAVFKPEYFNLDKIRFTASYDDVPFGVSDAEMANLERSDDVDRATKERLASLGYIQLDEEKKQANRFQTRNPFLEAVQFQKAGEIDQAIAIYKTILKEEPETKNAVSIYNSLGLIYRNQNKYALSKKYIRKAIKEDKTIASLYINLGNIEKHFGYYNKAYRAYKRAMKIDPAEGMANYAMGLMFEEQEEWAKAEKNFRSAVALRVEISSLPSRIMAMLEKQKKTTEIKKMYEHFALERTPKQRFQFFIDESQRYIAANRLKEALEALFEALRIQPKNAILYNDIGGIFLRQNNKTKSITYFKKAMELDPGNVLSYLNISSTYLESNRPKMAQTYLRKSLKIDPKNKHAFYLMGLTNIKLMENRMARTNFKKVLKIDPTFTAASEKLEQLKKVE